MSSPGHVLHFSGPGRWAWDARMHFADASCARTHLSSVQRCRDPRDLRFVPDERVPDGPWLEFAESPFEASRENARFDAGCDVALIDVPREIVAMLRAWRHDTSLAVDEALQGDARLALEEWLRTIGTPGSFTIHPVRDVQADLPTTSYNGDGLLLGLHLDSWDTLPSRERRTAQNRICINLGESPRHFVFVPLTISSLAEAGVITDERLDSTVLRTRYYPRLAPMPVVRVRVDPGQTYVAATENLIHDGSSLGDSQPATVLTVRGRFDRPLPQRETV